MCIRDSYQSVNQKPQYYREKGVYDPDNTDDKDNLINNLLYGSRRGRSKPSKSLHNRDRDKDLASSPSPWLYNKRYGSPVPQEKQAYGQGGDPYGKYCLLYTSPSPRDRQKSRMPSSA
eukprot:TRINITY_DN15540_c0_g1_i1.p3 TRINITY_DN15540_c0_g1~~TRINITY_DN15540_c0_g1_i1.p3  ORF type:complete len:128 (-),score=35.58 TRINITY_DN15540_c0_g1_i1:9-362(-)